MARYARQLCLRLPVVCLVFAGGCASVAPDRGPPSAGAISSARLFDPATVIEDGWQHIPLKGETDYRISVLDGRLAFRARGTRSASMLARRVSVDHERCPTIEWSWAVTRLQSTADLRTKEGDDVAASVFLLFGDPGMLFDPKPVPTIRYVWSNERFPVGTIMDNPYMPGTVRNIVLRSGGGGGDRWVTERRDIVADFAKAFGRRPAEPVRAVALFTDNDQTEEPVEAYYGSGRILCSSAKPR